MTDSVEVDVAIIGAGTAGLNAVREAEKAGKRWLLIESGSYGTTCAKAGCMPSKLLIAAADVAHEARRAALFGVCVRNIDIDGKAVMARVRRERDQFVDGVIKDIEVLPRRNRHHGVARFVGATTLEVAPRNPGDDSFTKVRTTATVVATGSSPSMPALFDGMEHRVFTTDNIFEREDLPRSLAVIGASATGLELGQAFARLGVDVTFFDHSEHPGPATDPKVRQCIDDVLRQELDLNMAAEILAVRDNSDGVDLHWRAADGQEFTSTFEAILVAAGRPPNIEWLNLAATGLPLDDKGFPPWNADTGQCGDLPIFLAGDVNGHRPLLHEAGDEGRISGVNAAHWPAVEAHERRTSLSIVFSDPQIAVVGTPHANLSGDVRVGEASFVHQGRARIMGVDRGLLRVYARREDGVLIGAELFGPRVEHLAHLLAWAVQEATPVQHLLRVPVYHPTLEEAMRSALRDLAKNLRVEDQCRTEDMSIAPGM